MIAYIKGKITFKNPTFILVETGGIGYHVNITLQTYSKIEKLEDIKVLTYLHIKEDSHTLFGFAEEAERASFKHLLSVSGIGTNTARIILSGMTAEEVRMCILSENVAAFNKVKGIGPKTAKRIILDLKDKMVKESGTEDISITPKDNTIREEALQALVALGFAKVRVEKALTIIQRKSPEIGSVEALIKMALKNLS